MLQDATNRRAAPTQKSKMSGFWSKVDFIGSKPPLSRENSSMIFQEIHGQQHLILLGGTTPQYGIFDYEAYNFDLYKRQWHKASIQGVQKQMKGTKSVAEIHQNQLLVYNFSG